MKSLKVIAHNIRVDAHAVWLCARDPQVPFGVRLFGIAIAGYALSPIDLIPDFIPVLGLIDDAILIPLGVWLFLKMVPETIFARHRAEAEMASQRHVSRKAAAVIIAIWVTLAGLLAFELYAVRYY